MKNGLLLNRMFLKNYNIWHLILLNNCLKYYWTK
ncbi:unnamed protein product [Schistosoma curassoni]|uniref:Uncharacterized protein n=1 Tax=Schistosoma curassoni TaxID=6186 RepID=A0A183L730_9TREM|nr:unnamed protein product [Schistosoma curassoni]